MKQIFNDFSLAQKNLFSVDMILAKLAVVAWVSFGANASLIGIGLIASFVFLVSQTLSHSA